MVRTIGRPNWILVVGTLALLKGLWAADTGVEPTAVMMSSGPARSAPEDRERGIRVRERPEDPVEVAGFADRRAPSSAEEEWVAVSLRDAAVKSGAIRRARLPKNEIEQHDLEDACRQGPEAFLNWVFGEDKTRHDLGEWPEGGPISSDPQSYCQFQMQLLAQAKGSDISEVGWNIPNERWTEAPVELGSMHSPSSNNRVVNLD